MCHACVIVDIVVIVFPKHNVEVTRAWRTDCGNTITVGGAVIFEHEGGRHFGEVVVIYRAADCEHAVVFQWEQHETQPYPDAVRLFARQRPVRIAAQGLVAALIANRWEPDAVVVALLPPQYR